jgi:geranylgeranyl diphosphate synthase, type I
LTAGFPKGIDMTTTPAHELKTRTSSPETRDRLLLEVEKRMHGFLAQQRERWSADKVTDTLVPIDAVAELLDAGGKRIRPAFCATGFLLAGGEPDDPVIVDASAAVEFLHAFALIHDDVLDDSPLRRGTPTVHTKYAALHASAGWRGESRRFGEGVAILAGDLAYVFADSLAADVPPVARQVWDELRAEMIIGQFVDVNAAAEFTVDPDLARWIAVCKSGRYTIHRPLLLGAAIAGRLDLSPAFEEYGVALGEAFQLRDDLIDGWGTSTTTGKPVNLDFDRHKMTLLLALALRRDDRVRELVTQDEWDSELLSALLIETGVRADVERRIDMLVEQACEAIDRAPVDEVWKAELASMAIQVTHRDH